MTTILNIGGSVEVTPAALSNLYSDALISLSDGTFIHIFEGFGAADDYGVYGQRFDGAGVAIGEPFLVNTTTSDYQSFGLGTALEDGGFVVVWNGYSEDVDAPDIFAQRYDAAGQKVGGEVRINTFTTDYQIYPSVAGLNDGGYVIAWSSNTQDGDRYGIYSQRFDASGAAVGGEVHVSTYTTLSQIASHVTALSDGGYVITWNSNGQDGDNYGVYAQRFDSTGAPVGDEVRVNTDTVGRQRVSEVTALADGGYVIAWYGAGIGDDAGVYFQRFDAAGAPAGDQTLVNSDTVGTQWFPLMQGLSDGGFVIAWINEQISGEPGSTTTRNEIDVQRYDASGHPLGDVLVIAYNAGETPSLSVGALPDGGFSVGWSGYDGYQWRVYQSVYNATTADDTGDHLIYGTNGDDVLAGTPGFDQIYGGDGHDVLTAVDPVESGGMQGPDSQPEAYGDDLYGGAGNDVLTGSIGDNFLDGGSGADTMSGGTGDDTYVVDDAGDAIAETLDEGDDIVESTISYVLADNVENLRLEGSANIDGTGNALGNFIGGNAGNNLLRGGAGNDSMESGGGTDVIDGGEGTDTYYNFVPYDSPGGATVDFTGAETATGITIADGTTLRNIESIVYYGIGNNNTITGSGGDDRLYFWGGTNQVLNGGAGNDYFGPNFNSPGSVPLMTINGGSGSDTVEISNLWNGNIVFDGTAAASDVFVAIAPGYSVRNVEQFIIRTYYGNDNLTGGVGDDILNASGGTNTINGGTGNDAIETGQGYDTINGGDGTDRVVADFSWQNGRVTSGFSTGGLYSISGPTAVSTLTNVEAVTIRGGSYNDFLVGLAGDDILSGGDGFDTLYGGLGSDILNAGNGGGNLWSGDSQVVGLAAEDYAVDILNGGSGGDVIYAGLGDAAHGGDQGLGTVDRIFVSFFGKTTALNLDLSTGDAFATLAAAAGGTYDGFEEIGTFGTVFDDTVIGSAGNDRLYDLAPADGSGGADHIEGRGGNDRISAGSGANWVDGGEGDDILYNTSFEAETFLGGSGNDVVFYGSTAPVDLIGNGADIIDGGSGKDLIDYFKLSVNLTVDLSKTTVQDTGFNLLTVSNVEDLYGGSGNDTFIGSATANSLDGGLGADSMAGGAGDDTYYADNAGDTVIEAYNRGTDTVYASLSYALAAGQYVENLILTGTVGNSATGNAFANSLTGNAGGNVLDGGAGNDTLAGGLGNDSYMVDASLDLIIEAASAGFDQVTALANYTLSANIETLILGGAAALRGTGNDQANLITGNGANNLLYGMGDNDRLDGGAGADTLVGGFGDDTFVVDNAGDKLVEFNNQGIDTVETGMSYALTGLYVENLTVSGTGNFAVGGNGFANVLIGNSGNNTINGGLNGDTMSGGAGNDLYFVDHIGDVVVELANEGKDAVNASITYTLTDNVETLALIGYQAINGTGNALDNTVTGNGNANQLNGGDGKDLLIGQGGNDILTGGAGADSFRFYRAGALNGLDHLTDFVSGTDKLQLTGADYGFAKGQVLTAAQVHTGGSVGAFGQFLYNIVNHTLYWDADGTGATAAVALAVFDNSAQPVAGDFVFL